jgi:hypothetical protein
MRTRGLLTATGAKLGPAVCDARLRATGGNFGGQAGRLAFTFPPETFRLEQSHHPARDGDAGDR